MKSNTWSEGSGEEGLVGEEATKKMDFEAASLFRWGRLGPETLT